MNAFGSHAMAAPQQSPQPKTMISAPNVLLSDNLLSPSQQKQHPTLTCSDLSSTTSDISDSCLVETEYRGGSVAGYDIYLCEILKCFASLFIPR